MKTTNKQERGARPAGEKENARGQLYQVSLSAMAPRLAR